MTHVEELNKIKTLYLKISLILYHLHFYFHLKSIQSILLQKNIIEFKLF